MLSRHRVSRAAIELLKRFEGYRRHAAQLPDGRWMISGGAQSAGNAGDFVRFLARLQPEGRVDPSFGTNGFVTDGFHSGVIAVQASGKILAASATSAGGMFRGVLVRLHPNGSRDLAFGTANGATTLETVVAATPTQFFESLDHAVKLAGREAAEGTDRHVSGQELLAGLRQYASELFGPLAAEVWRRWGVRESLDWGRIVFLLVEAGMLNRQENDTIEDFRSDLDFDRAFVDGYRPRLPPAHGFRSGQGVFHNKFGEGVIVTLEGSGEDARAQVNFGRHGLKWLQLSIAKLTPVP